MAKDIRPSEEEIVGRPPGIPTLTPSAAATGCGGAAAAAFACAAACVASDSAVAALTRVEQLSGPMCCQVIDIIEAGSRDRQYVVPRIIRFSALYRARRMIS